MNNSDSFFSPLSPPLSLSLSFLFIFQLHQCDDFLNFPSHFSPLVAVFHSSSLPCISDPMIFSCSSVFFFVFFHIRPIHHFSQFSSFISISSPSISAFFSFFPFSSFSLENSFSPFSSSSYLSYTNAMISSIFPVIFWERCSPLPHFIHPWSVPIKICEPWHGNLTWNNAMLTLEQDAYITIFVHRNHFLGL